MKKLEDVWYPRDPFWDEKEAAFCEFHTEDGVVRYPKDIKYYGHIGDLEQIGKKFEICNLYNPTQAVRKIEVREEDVCVDVLDGSAPKCFPKDQRVYYEEWFMDRGSYLIWVDDMGIFGKLATEHDPVKEKCEE